jgi:predicted  nucleic acid-binding Zn-ribbon protein
MVSHLEDQIKSTSASLSASRHQTTEMESRVEEMRALADQAETARQEQARLLKKCQLDLEAADQRIRDKDANIGMCVVCLSVCSSVCLSHDAFRKFGRNVEG